jgi:hypothetical protein
MNRYRQYLDSLGKGPDELEPDLLEAEFEDSLECANARAEWAVDPTAEHTFTYSVYYEDAFNTWLEKMAWEADWP